MSLSDHSFAERSGSDGNILEVPGQNTPTKGTSLLGKQENASLRRWRDGHRASSALISLSFAAMLGVPAAGCSGEGDFGEGVSKTAESNEAAENALIEAHLQTRGYDTSTLQFGRDTVVVEDDMVMSRAVLLDDAEAEASGVVDKGYFHTTGLFSGKRIALSFAGGVSTAWQAALNAARNEWNSRTPMFARDPGSAATISVVVQALMNPSGTPNTNAVASGTIPPGRTIRLNSNYSGCGSSLESLPANIKTYAALHEMGHVLGFAHPPPNTTNNPRVHIAGTAVSNGFVEPTYETVMETGACFTRTTLFPDDVLSAQKKYPSCMDGCEHNCTFLSDPGQIGLCMAGCPSQCGG
jgi:hypothetical protein